MGPFGPLPDSLGSNTAYDVLSGLKCHFRWSLSHGGPHVIYASITFLYVFNRLWHWSLPFVFGYVL